MKKKSCPERNSWELTWSRNIWGHKLIGKIKGNFDKLLGAQHVLACEWETREGSSLRKTPALMNFTSRNSTRFTWWRFKKYAFLAQQHEGKSNHLEYTGAFSIQRASLQKNFARAIQLEGSNFFHSNPLQYFYLTKGEETVNMGKGFKEIDRKHCSQRKEDKTGNKQTKNSIPGEIFVRITASKHKHNKRLRFNGKVIECSSSFIPLHQQDCNKNNLAGHS